MSVGCQGLGFDFCWDFLTFRGHWDFSTCGAFLGLLDFSDLCGPFRDCPAFFDLSGTLGLFDLTRVLALFRILIRMFRLLDLARQIDENKTCRPFGSFLNLFVQVLGFSA